jgi:putative heme-binding domain-containing protein
MLGRLRDPRAFAALLDDWRAKTPQLRGMALDALLATEEGSLALLAAVQQGTVPPQDFDIRRRQQLAEHKNEAIRVAATKVFVDKIDANRSQVIGTYAAEVGKLSGDVARGKEVFAKKCSQCHKLDGVGHEVGPDLAALTDRSTQALLVAVLDPNRAVESKFIEYLAVTTDGRQHRGMLAEENDVQIVLAGPDAKQARLLKIEVEEIVGSGKSLMPEGLEKELPPQALADLLAYFGGFRPPPKALPGNKPQPVTASDDGSLRLPASAARVYGPNIVFEAKYGNLGYWSSPEDRAAWDVTVPAAGQYQVVLDYACAPPSSPNTAVIHVAGEKLAFQVAATGSWDQYLTREVGKVTLPAGPAEVSIGSEGPIDNALLDLRSVRLVPVK